MAGDLPSILRSLAIDTEKRIRPERCIFERTLGGSEFHYKVPNGRPRVIAWANIRATGRKQDMPKRPCAIVNIKGDLVKADVFGLVFHANANWGHKGPGEWQGVIYEIGDAGYQGVLCALSVAAEECLRRAGFPIGAPPPRPS